MIRAGTTRLTEERVRVDMDHIHNLVIIAVVCQGQDMYVSTNSVNNAMFARSCMSSRTAYKGLRIDWYPDECADPIPQQPVAPPAMKPQKAQPPNPNRFNLLLVDEDEDGSGSHGSQDGSSGVSDVNLGPRSNATSTVID